MFWDNFMNICNERGLKPTPVIKAAGLASSSIARWQNGAAPNGDSLIGLAKYLDCSIDYLLTGSEFHKSGSKEITHEEFKLLDMYRCLPEQSQEFIYDSIEMAYEKEIQRKETASESLA
nr:MAG TPA: transcriptional repressor DicA [Caudoviricetes sp.]